MKYERQSRGYSGKIGKLSRSQKRQRRSVVDMKVRGCSNKEIFEATAISLKTVQNIVSKGGRLYYAIQSLRENKTITLAENNLTVWDSLLSAKDPAVQELKRIALESPNDVARLKAIDMIIELTGIRDEDKPPLLDPHNMNDCLERFGKWIKQKLLKTFQNKAPKVIFEYSQDTSSLKMITTPEDLDRLEKIVKGMDRLTEKLKNDPHQGEDIRR